MNLQEKLWWRGYDLDAIQREANEAACAFGIACTKAAGELDRLTVAIAKAEALMPPEGANEGEMPDWLAGPLSIVLDAICTAVEFAVALILHIRGHRAP